MQSTSSIAEVRLCLIRLCWCALELGHGPPRPPRVYSNVNPRIGKMAPDGRDLLQQLLKDVTEGKGDYRAILAYDVGRWGRFQDADESAHYEYVCKSARGRCTIALRISRTITACRADLKTLKRWQANTAGSFRSRFAQDWRALPGTASSFAVSR
jgi:hypothetical protein